MELSKAAVNSPTFLHRQTDSDTEVNLFNYLKKLQADAAAGKTPLWATDTLTLGTIASGAAVGVTVTVPGAKVGDFAVAAPALNLQGAQCTARVIADDLVYVRVKAPGDGSSRVYAVSTVAVAVIPLAMASRFGSVGVDTWDPASVGPQDGPQSKDVAVPGAQLGDLCLIGFNPSVAGAYTDAVSLQAFVKVAGTVRCSLINETADVLDCDSGRVCVLVIPAGTQFPLTGSLAYANAGLAGLAGEQANVTIAGAAPGQIVVIGCSVDAGGNFMITGNVTSQNTVTVRVQNVTLDSHALSATLSIGLLPANGALGMNATVKAE